MATWIHRLLIGLGAGSVAAAASMVGILRAIHRSCGLEPPTDRQLEEENLESSALFRALPALKSKVAFRALGCFPTPVQWGEVGAGIENEAGGATTTLRFLVKREDLASSEYGGNKVRTLQHQLAVCEARAERGELKHLIAIGSGGSNQIVASVVHGRKLEHLPLITASWVPDPPDLDNALNMLSALSFPLASRYTWGEGGGLGALVAQLARTLVVGDGVVQPPGGNSPAGVLGQIGGALELAEQISRGECDDVDAIYLAVGSSCTISGLTIGVALARDHLGMPAFQRPGFQIVGVPVHHTMAAAHRTVGFGMAGWSRIMPLTMQHTVRTACDALQQLGGLDGILEDSLKVLSTQVRIASDANVVGIYGAHSSVSRAAAQLYDETGKVYQADGEPAPPLWLCGHFTAKAWAVMVSDLRQASKEGRELRALFWQTKSAVQPRGDEDEWRAGMCAMPEAVRKWADRGAAESKRRPGKVDTVSGTAEDYRQLMSKL